MHKSEDIEPTWQWYLASLSSSMVQILLFPRTAAQCSAERKELSTAFT